MAAPCTGVILAGGESKRFGRQNKAFIRIGGQRILDRLMGVYQPLFDQVVLVTNDPVAYMDIDALIVTDHFAARSSLNGLHAGLFSAAYEYAFFAACDTPFVTKALVQAMLERIEAKTDLVIPSTTAGYEPLFAVYKKTCLPAMAELLMRNHLKIQGLFPKLRVKTVAEADLRKVDPELASFFNINTTADLAKAEAIASGVDEESNSQ
jgi:molybdenum cofactor guanylyltransferase